MLQVIESKDIRPGEPRWFCSSMEDAQACMKNMEVGDLHTDDAVAVDCVGQEFAIVNRPSPAEREQILDELLHIHEDMGVYADPRDPARIDPILARLRAAWLAHPDQRLGQLLVNSLVMPPDATLERAMSRLYNAECTEFGVAGAPIEWGAPSAPAKATPSMPEAECPGPDCLLCNGAACEKCGAGATRSPAFDGIPCEHDGQERHEPFDPAAIAKADSSVDNRCPRDTCSGEMEGGEFMDGSENTCTKCGEVAVFVEYRGDPATFGWIMPSGNDDEAALDIDELEAHEEAIDPRGYIVVAASESPGPSCAYIDTGPPDRVHGGDGDDPIQVADGAPVFIAAAVAVLNALPRITTSIRNAMALRDEHDRVIGAARVIRRERDQMLAALRAQLAAEVAAHAETRGALEAKDRGYRDLHEMLPGDCDIWTKVDALKSELADTRTAMELAQSAADRRGAKVDLLAAELAAVSALEVERNQLRNAILHLAMAVDVEAVKAESCAEGWRLLAVATLAEVRKLAAARVAPPDVETAIVGLKEAACGFGIAQQRVLQADVDAPDERASAATEMRSAAGLLKAAIARAISDATAGAVAYFIDGHAKRLCELVGGMWADESDSWASQVHNVLNHLRGSEDGTVIDGRASQPATVGGLSIDDARAIGIAGVRAAIGEVGRQTGPGTHTVEGLGAGEREVEWKLKLLGRRSATVGVLLATAPVGSIVEWLDGDGDWNQAVVLVDDRIPCSMHRWWMAGRWCQYGGFDDAGRHLRLPARLVPAHLADADPASRGPIGEG